jgi:DNA-binding HxlR family transcriptional regulator
MEYSLAERGKSLIPALESVYQWAEAQMSSTQETEITME